MAVSKYPVFVANKTLDEKVATAKRLVEKSFMSRGTNHSHAKMVVTTVTKKRAGKIRLARRS